MTKFKVSCWEPITGTICCSLNLHSSARSASVTSIGMLGGLEFIQLNGSGPILCCDLDTGASCAASTSFLVSLFSLPLLSIPFTFSSFVSTLRSTVSFFA